VDYLIHICEGYIVALGHTPQWSKIAIRGHRVKEAVSSVGVPVTASAFTTIGASVVLIFSQIQLFAKFGEIVALNTAISFVYTLVFATGMLSWCGPVAVVTSLRRRAMAVVVAGVTLGVAVLIMYIVSVTGTAVRGPDGAPFF